MSRRVRVAICWTHVSGYMASCWRALAAHPDIDVSVALFAIASKDNVGFQEAKLLGNLPHVVWPIDQYQREVGGWARGLKPDVVVVAGWAYPALRALAHDPGLASAKVVMTMDTPWRWNWRQFAGRLAHRKFFARVDRAVVAAERTWQFARWLGFEEHRIVRGLYGVDEDAFGPVLERRLARGEGWPRRFMFMGRYAPEKAVGVLIDAYRQYASGVTDPWPLDCYGRGELASVLANAAGVQDCGFIQPEEQPGRMESSGCFVLPSMYEPWGAVLAEAGMSGLPLICSEACGAGVNLVQHLYNGLRVTTGDAGSLARAMRWMHDHPERLAEMGRRSRELSSPYTHRQWVTRWVAMLDELTRS
jgi:glycosyltransferase involved in cell wall biosynthesis